MLLPTRPARVLTRAVPLTFTVLSIACADDAPVAPRVPARPQALAAAAVTVTNTDDAGAGSLRQAIADAAGGATIQFDAGLAGKTIVLTSGPLVIDKPVTIDGPTTGGITISGGLRSRVVNVGASAEVIFRNLSIVDGRAAFGGGIYSLGNVTLDHSLVANNETPDSLGAFGGGVYSSASATLVNSTVSGNVAYAGGGVFARGLTIRNSTITGNSSDFGGGVVVTSSMSARNSIIAYNVDRSDDPKNANCLFVVGAAVTYSGMNMTNDASCGTDAALLVSNLLLMGPLANNGGPTKTHAVLVGSAAIDGGVQCTETTDQRYIARPQGNSCDVGAYEFEYLRLTLTAGPNGKVDRKTGVATVSGTITCPEPGTFTLDVGLSQTQKVTGKFTTIVQANAPAIVFCNGTTSWSATVTPQQGSFENGAATATVQTTTRPFAYLPASLTAPVKLFSVQ